MTRLTGTIILSVALCVVASIAVAGSPSSYTLSPAQPTSNVAVQTITPVARTATTQPQPAEVYITQPTQPAPSQGIIYAPVNEPVPDSSGYVITPAPVPAQ